MPKIVHCPEDHAAATITINPGFGPKYTGLYTPLSWLVGLKFAIFQQRYAIKPK